MELLHADHCAIYEEGLVKPGARKNPTEVCAHPRRHRRRSIWPISSETGLRKRAFCRISLEPECGGRSEWVRTFLLGSVFEQGRRDVNAQPSIRDHRQNGVPMKKNPTDATIQNTDDSTMGVAVRRSSGVVRQVVTSTGQLDKPSSKTSTTILPTTVRVYRPCLTRSVLLAPRWRQSDSFSRFAAWPPSRSTSVGPPPRSLSSCPDVC